MLQLTLATEYEATKNEIEKLTPYPDYTARL
jgi:hypothetical protein